MTPATIHHDGMTWPLDTFLDSYRYVRTGGQVPDFAALPGVLDVVTIAGEMMNGQEARAVAWHNVLAARAPDGSEAFDLCPGCGGTLVGVSIRTSLRKDETAAGGRRWMQIEETAYCEPCQEECDDHAEPC